MSPELTASSGGLALRGETLVVGLRGEDYHTTLEVLRNVMHDVPNAPQKLESVPISE